MGTYITVVGKDHYLVLNSLWAVLKEGVFQPDKLILLQWDDKDCSGLYKQIKELLNAYEIEVSIEHTSRRDGIVSEDEETALDISGGDMESTARLLIDNEISGLKHIFLLKIEGSFGSKIPYPLIDSSKLHLLDILDDEVKTIG